MPTRKTGFLPAAAFRGLLAPAFVSAAVAAWEDARADDCAEAARPLREALAARDVEAARRHYEAAHAAFACDDAFRARAARAVANLHVSAAQKDMARGAGLRSQRARIERGVGYARVWAGLALLGDLAREERAHARAAALYQEAIVAINNEGETPAAPPRAEIERIVALAAQSRMLAGSWVETPVNRAGEPDGLAATAIRGIEIGRVPIPVTFLTGSAEFDELGRRYAGEMADWLARQDIERIVVSAHTDPRGSEEYNMALSQRRGDALAAFLRRQGIAKPIEVIARGESEPLAPIDAGSYSQEERWRMERRVELVR